MSLRDFFPSSRGNTGELPRPVLRLMAWLVAIFLVIWPLTAIHGKTGSYLGWCEVGVAVLMLLVSVPWGWLLFRRRTLWSLRNKLAITYLLIGVAPVVLFVTLVLVSSYIAAGQFAIHLVSQRLQGELGLLHTENVAATVRLSRLVSTRPKNEIMDPTNFSAELLAPQRSENTAGQLAAFIDKEPMLVSLNSGFERSPLGLPEWTPQARGYRGLVYDSGRLFLASIVQRTTDNGHVVTMIRSIPIDRSVMDRVAAGLGRAALVPGLVEPMNTSPGIASREQAAKDMALELAKPQARKARDAGALSISGGSLPQAVNIADLHVHFFSTTPTIDWDTAAESNIPIEVDSRPSLLYTQLFAASLEGVVPGIIRVGLIFLCIVFALLEIFALYMALRLSGTITTSVADLYSATLAIDRGDLGHRITVTRNDQLADLSRSFNRMTGSLQRLLMEQKEKERLQSELSIAQEVQANLFPRAAVHVPSLELHGVCRPARSVSGDYYDFLLLEEEKEEASENEVTGVGIALGDISGKGISAALLMATLYSAVRAFRFANEVMASGVEEAPEEKALLESPSKILALLNRHLYRSTQPEKYATLFLAQYDVTTSRMTYSNAGQLPPFILCKKDLSVKRLDRGGTVVGLMDGMEYEEGSVQMELGDLFIGYSDGVTEPENEFGEFGEERLLEVVTRYRNEPLHVISAQVLQALDAWIGAEEQPDDITLVLARRV